MQAESVIANSITQDIRLKGHQSIRFIPGGFSVLISDASYTPVYLKDYTLEPETAAAEIAAECSRILEEEELFTFEGETILITDSMAVTLLPRQFFNRERKQEILDKVCSLDDSDEVMDRHIKNRNSFLVYAVPEKIMELGHRFSTEAKILHTSECLISLSDQVKASDHQRGFVLAEVQSRSLDILVIAEDRIQLLNRYSLNDTSDFIYHILNTMRQLDLDLETIPVYLSGIIHEGHDLCQLLRKYIRNVLFTPYYLEHLSKEEIQRFMILSEGSKCA